MWFMDYQKYRQLPSGSVIQAMLEDQQWCRVICGKKIDFEME